MIISASRRTDIPTYFFKWFVKRLEEGFVLVRNPINASQVSKINLSPEYIDCIVFWTKNPYPALSDLDKLSAYMYYFQFTLTSYGQEVEVNVPHKNARVIDTFKRLSEKIGRDRVIWRYDPILLSDRYTMEYHFDHFGEIALKLKDYTCKCTISFIDEYAKIRNDMARLNISTLTFKEKTDMAARLSKIAHELGLSIDACAEDIDLGGLGIGRAKCIDDNLIERLVGCSLKVEKDKNQRLECGCVASIDIGMYNTCENGCMYCYANHSQTSVRQNISY